MQLEQDRWTKPAAGTGYVDETCSWDRIGGECCGEGRLKKFYIAKSHKAKNGIF